jgi:DNA-binding Lrp family transcriptional regulator
MDQLDIRILRELMQGRTLWPARPGLTSSYRFLAKQLGVSPGTVRNRIVEMNRTGVLNGTGIYPNVNLLDLRSGSYTIEVAEDLRKSDVLDRLATVDGVVFFENFRGRLLGMGLTYPEEEKLDALLDRIDRVAHANRGSFTRVRHPPFSGTLLAAEWELLDRLLTGTFRTYTQLGRELRISPRTLNRRLRKLVESGAVLTFPRIDLHALRGGVAADLLVSYADPSTKAESQRRIRARVDDWLFFAGVWEEFEVYRLILPNVGVATELGEEVARLPGIRTHRVELLDSLIDRLDRLRPYVARREGRPSGPGVSRTGTGSKGTRPLAEVRKGAARGSK